ncbi:MAG: N-acetyltransferase [Ilumatobacteraceae bacterium]
MSSTVSLTIPDEPLSTGDLESLVAVAAAQDTAWFGAPEVDADDLQMLVDRAIAECGSLGAGARVAVDDATGAVVGVALLVGHGHTEFLIDPAAVHAHTALRLLLDWLLESGAADFETPVQDTARVAALLDHGLVPTRSSFDLERPVDVTDLGAARWPSEITLSTFRAGVDDQDVHDVIYSVWTDVVGHTFRPIEEWRSLIIDRPWFDPSLIVVTRRPDGAVAGVAICREFGDGVGWVSQIAVGRPDRGLGLGRAMLVEGFRRLAARPGVTSLGLSVEAENATALGLYRSVGLEITREWVHYAMP